MQPRPDCSEYTVHYSIGYQYCAGPTIKMICLIFTRLAESTVIGIESFSGSVGGFQFRRVGWNLFGVRLVKVR